MESLEEDRKIEEAVKSIKKTCVLCDPCSYTIRQRFLGTGSHEMEAIEKKCWIFIIKIHIK